MQIKATREAVFNAADELTAARKPVSADAVIAITGGSKSTVSPLLADWRAEQERRDNIVEAGDPPERISSLMTAAGREAWVAAVEAANDRFAGDCASHAAVVETLEGEIEHQKLRIAELEVEIGGLTGKLAATEADARRAAALERKVEGLAADLVRLQVAHDDLFQEHNHQRERAAVAEDRYATLKEAQAAGKEKASSKRERSEAPAKAETAPLLKPACEDAPSATSDMFS
jgi:chromosome segregation ATPase